MLKLRLACALLLYAFPTTPAEAEPTVEGRWLTDDGKGVVRIAACGARLCGWVVEVLDKGPNVPRTDVNNPDPHLRGRPILGLPTLGGFVGSGTSWRDGHAYDPKSGRTYRASLALNRDGSLKLTGCVLFICESRRWTRAR